MEEISLDDFNRMISRKVVKKSKKLPGKKEPKNTVKKEPKKRAKNEAKNVLSLDKLAQLTPAPHKVGENQDVMKMRLLSLSKRARAKYIGDTIKSKLVDLHSPKKSTYYKSLLCASTLHQSGEKITSRYCNQRWCIVCSRIRTAKAINGYHSELNKYTKLYFLTLTIVNVRSFELRKAVGQMNANWRLIVNKRIKKSYLKKSAFNGVRKLECTYNLQVNNYHPHYHIIIDNKECAEYILAEWMQLYPGNSIKAQNLKEINLEAREETLREMFKYSTKFHSTFIDQDGEKQTGISVYHLDIIFRCLHGLRTYQPFGEVRKVSEEVDNLEAEVYEDIVKRKTEWSWNYSDWYNIDDGECLTFYEPSKKDEYLKDNIVLVKPINKKHLKKVQE